MRATINCEKMNVWHQTRPWQMERCAMMKGIVASQECNFLNGFERKTHTPSCMYSKRCRLLCLCVRIAHRNSNVPSGRRRIRHCRSSWTSPFIETFVDIPRTYHWFSYRHVVKSIHDVITYYTKCMLYKFRIRRSFLPFSQRCRLGNPKAFLISGSITYYSLSYTQNRLPRITV